MEGAVGHQGGVVQCAKGGFETYLAPVLATERLPDSFWAVTSHAMSELARPRTGLSVAAMAFCFFHIKVRVAGRTAEEMMTPTVSLVRSGRFLPKRL